MKKTLLVTIDFPPQLGGVANYLANICGNLPQDKIVVLAPLARDTEFDQKQSYKIDRRKLFFPLPFIWPKWLPLFWHVFRIIRKEKIELIQISHVLPVGYVTYVFHKIFRIPYIVYTHGMDILTPQKELRKKKLMIKVLNQAQSIIANSQFTKRKIVELGVSEGKITVIYPCPSIVQSPQSTVHGSRFIEKYNLRDKKILLTVGRLVERKGHDMVIKALPEVLKRVPNAVYLIVGDGPYRNKLSELSKTSELSEKVIFAGAVPDEDLPAYYDLCDIFIMPSRQIEQDIEGFGIVYLEANSFAKPVIAGRSGGISEAVVEGRTGLLVDPENPAEITSAILALLTNEELMNKLGVQGKERVEKEFQWQKQIEQFKKILC